MCHWKTRIVYKSWLFEWWIGNLSCCGVPRVTGRGWSILMNNSGFTGMSWFITYLLFFTLFSFLFHFLVWKLVAPFQNCGFCEFYVNLLLISTCSSSQTLANCGSEIKNILKSPKCCEVSVADCIIFYFMCIVMCLISFTILERFVPLLEFSKIGSVCYQKRWGFTEYSYGLLQLLLKWQLFIVCVAP